MSDLRVVGLRFEVDVGDGKTKIVQMRRAISDTTATVDKLNRELGDNVRVSTEKVQTDKEVAQQARLIISQQERQRRKTAEVVKQYTSLNQTIRQYGNDFETVNAIVRLGSNATEQQKQQVAELVQEYQHLRNAGDKAGGSFRNLRGISQNLGWQLQDTAVQAQMGTSWFTIIAQQGSQFAGAFGPMGAMIGAGIAIGFAAMPSVIAMMDEASVSTKELEEAQSRLEKVFELSNGTVSSVTNELRELYKVDKALAELKIRKAVLDAEKSMKGLIGTVSSGFNEAVDNTGWDNFFGFDNLKQQFKEINQIQSGERVTAGFDRLADKLGIASGEAETLLTKMREFETTGDPGDITQYTQSLVSAYGSQNLSLVDLTLSLSEAGIKYKEYLNVVKDGDAIIEGTLEPLTRNQEITESLSDRYARMRRQLEMNERQITVDNFLRKEATGLTALQVDQTLKAIDSYYSEKQALEARNEAIEKAKELDDERIKQREKLLKPIEQSLVVSSDNPVTAEVERNKQTMDTLQAQMQATKEYEYSERARINDLIEKEEQRHIENLTEAQFTLASNQVALIGQTGDFLSGLVNEMSNGGERVREQMEEMNTAQKTMFFITRSIAAAEALINGIALGGKLASMFPLAAPAMVATGTALGAANAGAIMGATFAGAFDNGGYIPSGQWGIASEYGDELVNGVMVRGPADVTSRVDTASMTQGGLNVTVENYASGVSHQVQQIDENTVRIIATQVFNQNIDKGVSGVLGKKGTKANKTLTGNYDVRGRV